MKKLGRKMMDLLRLWAVAFVMPFAAMLILIEESKTIDEDGTWSRERGKRK